MRLIKAMLAAIVLAALVAGPPWLLVHFIGNPWPEEGVSLDAPLTDNAIIGLLAVVVWVLWAQLMVCILVEAIAAFTDDRVQLRVPLTFGVQQQFARRLVSAIVIATVATPVAIAGTASAAAEPPTPAAATSLQLASLHQDQRQTPGTQAEHNDGGAHGRDDAGGRHQVDRTSTVTVMRLDSLWSIAERVLDDGDRWPEIAALNEGQVMTDGARFTSADHIKPGWKLQVPADAKTSEVDHGDHRGTHEVVVEAGDTLSEIARTELGDADAYPRIFEASQGIAQPGGQHLTDPNVIDVGWTLTVPGTDTKHSQDQQDQGQADQGQADQGQADGGQDQGSTQEQPPQEQPTQPETEPETEPETDEQQGGDLPSEETVPPAEEGSPTAEPTPGEETAPQTDQVDQNQQVVQDDVADDEGWPVRTIGGVCALLAGTLIALIAARRASQRRRRKPGTKVPLPTTAAAAEVEQEVRAVVADLSVDSVDAALQQLATAGAPEQLPGLRLVRLTSDQIDLYFDDATVLPAPWEATTDASVWVLPAESLAALPETAPTAAPYPALVSIGHDVEDGVVLLNLAHVGDFGVTGDEQLVREAFSAIALELGTVAWAADVDLTVLGDLDELAQVLEHDRLRYVPRLDAATRERIELTAASGTTVVLDAGRVLSGEQTQRLRSHGATVVTNGWRANDAGLDLTSSNAAALLPYQLEVTPQLVDERTYQGLLDVLRTSLVDPADVAPRNQNDGPASTGTTTGGVLPFDHDPPTAEPPQTSLAGEEPGDSSTAAGDVPAPAWVDEPAPVTRPLTSPSWSPTPAAAVPSGGFMLLEELATDDERHEHGDPADSEQPDEHQADVVDEHQADVVDGVHSLLQTGHPVIRLLGPVVDIVGADAAAPTSETHQKVCTRIATFIALNPDASRPSLTQAVWGGQRVSASTVDSRISNLRNWLGEDTVAGTKYLPPRTLHFTDQITTDWQVLNDLVGQRPATAPTTALEQALSLVRGRPLEGEESKHYGFAEYALSDMVDLIVDVAYELARRRYFEGAWRKAGQAAALGVLIDPGNERLWRIRIHAAHSAGNAAEVAEAVDRMHARISELGFELEDETTDLLQALREHDTNTIEQAREAL